MTDQNSTIVCWITAAHRSALNLVAAKITHDHLETSSFVTVSFITLSPSKFVTKIKKKQQLFKLLILQ